MTVRRKKGIDWVRMRERENGTSQEQGQHSGWGIGYLYRVLPHLIAGLCAHTAGRRCSQGQGKAPVPRASPLPWHKLCAVCVPGVPECGCGPSSTATYSMM